MSHVDLCVDCAMVIVPQRSGLASLLLLRLIIALPSLKQGAKDLYVVVPWCSVGDKTLLTCSCSGWLGRWLTAGRGLTVGKLHDWPMSVLTIRRTLGERGWRVWTVNSRHKLLMFFWAYYAWGKLISMFFRRLLGEPPRCDTCEQTGATTTLSSLASLKSGIVNLLFWFFWYQFTKVVIENRPLNVSKWGLFVDTNCFLFLEVTEINNLYVHYISNKKLGRCWDCATCEPLDAAKVQNFITGYCCDDVGRLWYACSRDTYLSCLMHYVIMIHRRYRETDRRHARSINATC